MTLQSLLAHLRYQLQRHGGLAVVGLVLIASAAGLQVFGVQPSEAEVVELNAQAAKLRLRNVKQPGPQEATQQRLAAFYAHLPTSASALNAVEIIHRTAASQGVKLANGEYRLVRDGSSPVQRYQLTLPARASYPSLRGWLAEVMNQVPSAALDEISFRRDDVGTTTGEARVRLTVYVRATSTAGKPVAGLSAVSGQPASALEAKRFDGGTADLFASQSWLPPPPPPSPAKAQTPLAPALPFRYLGKVLEGAEVLAFVGEGARTHLLRKGDSLPGYKVADITATDISFVYLPLNETQRLTFGSAN